MNMLKWYYKYINNKLPHYFKSFKITTHEDIHYHDTRNKKDVTRPFTRIEAAKKCLRNHIPIILRATSSKILEKSTTHSFQRFSKYAKDRIIEKYQE